MKIIKITNAYQAHNAKALTSKTSFKGIPTVSSAIVCDTFKKAETVLPKVSVILPVYNTEKYLKKCLESLKKQTLKEMEFICVNDGSTDKSLNILKDFAKQDSRFKVFTQKNQGPGIARNEGLKYAKGEYVGFVDPDDWTNPEMFENLFNYAKKHECDIVASDYNICNEKGKIVQNKKLTDNFGEYFKPKKDEPFSWENLKPAELYGLDIPVWNKIFKRDLLIEKNVEFGKERMSEDVQFTIKAVLNSSKLGYIDSPQYNYLLRKGSLIHKKSDAGFCVFDVYKNLEKILDEKGLKEPVKEEFSSWVHNFFRFHYDRIPENSRQEFKEKCKNILSPEHNKMVTKMMEQEDKIKKEKETVPFWSKIFSVRKEHDESFIEHTVVRLFGLKIKI